MTLDELATSAGIPRRRIERQFRQQVNEAPAQTYRNMRLERAHILLTETNLSVMEIAMAAGFHSKNGVSRQYKDRCGETPFGHRGRLRATDDA